MPAMIRQLTCGVFAVAMAAEMFASAAQAGDFFIYAPPINAAAGSTLNAALSGPANVVNNSGMTDLTGLKLGLHDNHSGGHTMWLSDNAPLANGSGPGTTAYITLGFDAPVNIDQLLVWNYNQENSAAPNLFLRGLRQVDITYSTGADLSGLGNTLYEDFILNAATGVNGQAATNDIAVGTPGVGINDIRAIRFSAQGGPGVGNYGGSGGGGEAYYGLSEVRFFSSVAPPPTRFVYAPPENTVAGSVLGPLSPAAHVNDNSGMSDAGNPNGATRFGRHDNHSGGHTMWLSDNAPVANGAADPSTTAFIKFDFGAPVTLGEMLLWNYNQENPAAANLFLRGLRQVDITYSTGADTSGLGNTLYEDLILNPADGANGISFTDALAIGAPGVGIENIRAVRISAQGGAGVGNYGGAGGSELYYGLSEVRFFAPVPEPASLALVGVATLGLPFRRRRDG